MRAMKFEKWQGLGNNFVFLSEVEFPGDQEFSRWAKILCNPSFGIGGDGLIWVGASKAADFKMVIYNSDGSAASMCGNGLRCAVALMYSSERITKKTMSIETSAGLKSGEVHLNEENQVVKVTINMGKPIWEPEQIPFICSGANTKEVELEAVGQKFAVTALNTGVPHGVVFVEDFDWDWQTAGEALMRHPAFPAMTNGDFVQVLAPDSLVMKVWERGAGPTLACGTGACASVVAAAVTGRGDRKARIALDGGVLEIFWDEQDDIWMTGAAERVFVGITDLLK